MVQQGTLVHDLRKAQGQCRIDTEKFANHDEAQEGVVSLDSVYEKATT